MQGNPVVPEAPTFYAVSLEPDAPIDSMRAKLRQALESADQGEGVLVLTDMFGGTPSNIALSFLDDFNVEVVTGFNLPMLIKLASVRGERTLDEAISEAQEAGRKYISVASKILNG